jgi:ferric-dicitrate binding protein FerR (iron transport regulator)
MSTIPEEKLLDLIDKYLNGGLNEEEKNELADYGAEYPQIWLLIARLEDPRQLEEDLKELSTIDSGLAVRTVLRRLRPPRRLSALKWAAAILGPFIILTAVFLIRQRDSATLTVRTSPSSQTSVVLPDSTRVWLNNASALTYPVAFKGKTRDVVLTGEAYFNVAKNDAQPFRIQARDLQVDVLGTEFNISAYDDEDRIRTTLFTGSLKLTRGEKQEILHPSQQADVLSHADWEVSGIKAPEDAIHWKSGYFFFDHAPLTEVIHQLARYYTTIEFQIKDVSSDRFCSGTVEMGLPPDLIISQLNLHARYEGNKLLITE